MVDYRQTPPIQWLPVFDAAATHLSFKKAADQLHVTPPAISQQIKALEEWLGVQLFERHTRRLSLTVEGEHYLQVARKVMRAHKQGYLEFQRRFHSASLHISAPLFIAQELLIPKYLSFNDFCPGTELRIEARMSLVDFEAEALDAAIRFGDGKWPGVDVQRLCHSIVTPVCSQEYLEKHSFSSFADLLKHRLIYSSSELRDWQPFLTNFANQEHQKLVCDSYMAAITSASQGLGIALAILPTTNHWVNDGRLVLPFPMAVKTEMGYWTAAPKRDQQSQVINGFSQWAKKLFDDLPSLNQEIVHVDQQAILSSL